MSTEVKDAIVKDMFGVFGKKAADVKLKKDEESNGLFFNPDPKNCANQTFYGTIRFLPNLHDADAMYVSKIQYWVPEGADLKGGFRFDSPKSLGKYENCPVAEKYWEMNGSDDARIKALSTKIQYSKRTFALVQIIKDLAKPDNNGKVMIWELPIDVQKKITALMYPSKEDIETAGAIANNPFDPINGHAMVLKIPIKQVTKEGKTSEYRDYDACHFNDKIKATMVLNGETEQLVLAEDPAELEKQQEAMLATILAGPNLQDYAYKPATEDQLKRVKAALENLSGQTVTMQEAKTEPATEAKAEPAKEPVAEAKAETAEEPVAEAKAEPAKEPVAEAKAETTQTDADKALLKELGLDPDAE